MPPLMPALRLRLLTTARCRIALFVVLLLGALAQWLVRPADEPTLQRSFAIACNAGTLIVVYLLAVRLFGSERLALGSALLLHATPMFVLLAASAPVTDATLMLCWALTVHLAGGATFDRQRWALVLAAAPLAMVAFIASGAAVMLAPREFHLPSMPALARHLAMLNPFIALAMLGGALHAVRRRREARADPFRARIRFLACMALPFLALAAGTSVIAPSPTTWAAPGYLTLVILAAWWLGARVRSHAARVVRQALVLCALTWSIAALLVARGWLAVR